VVVGNQVALDLLHHRQQQNRLVGGLAMGPIYPQTLKALAVVG
jgi:hypothetical protein